MKMGQELGETVAERLSDDQQKVEYGRYAEYMTLLVSFCLQDLKLLGKWYYPQIHGFLNVLV